VSSAVGVKNHLAATGVVIEAGVIGESNRGNVGIGLGAVIGPCLWFSNAVETLFVVGGRRVGESAIIVEDEGSVGRTGHDSGGESRAVRCPGIIGQDTPEQLL